MFFMYMKLIMIFCWSLIKCLDKYLWCLFANRNRATNELNKSTGYWFIDWCNLFILSRNVCTFRYDRIWKGGFRVFKFLNMVDDVAVSTSSNWNSALVSKQWPEVFEGISFCGFQILNNVCQINVLHQNSPPYN